MMIIIVITISIIITGWRNWMHRLAQLKYSNRLSACAVNEWVLDMAGQVLTRSLYSRVESADSNARWGVNMPD